MNTELRLALEQVAKRARQRRLWTTLAVCWLVWAFVGIALKAWFSEQETLPASMLWIVGSFLSLAVATGLVCVVWSYLFRSDGRSVARRIEARYPELNTALLAAVEGDSVATSERYGFLRTALLSTVLKHRRTHDWNGSVSSGTLFGAKAAHAAALSILLVVTLMLTQEARSKPYATTENPASRTTFEIQVEPGDAEVELGSPLLIVARFGDQVPAEASLIVENFPQAESGGSPRTMTRSLEDPTFAGRIERVDADFAYHVAYADRKSETYRVRVFEYPQVVRMDAELTFPAYTSLSPKVAQDVRHVTAVEGTELKLLFHLNKKVVTARIVDKNGRSLALSPSGDADGTYSASITLDETHRFQVELTDDEGRRNKTPTEFTVNVTRNRPPIVKAVMPAKDTRVSPVEELSLKASVEDDYGVVRHGVSYALAGREPVDVELDTTAEQSRKLEAGHLLDFESLAAAPDELVTYFLWAEDIGPNGEPRRTSSDMYFAEVRPFEEIFRQGEQPPGGSAQQQEQQGSGNGQEAMQLAELQKQIISATWNLIRRESSPNPSDEFSADAALLLESQQSAVEQAAQLTEKLQDATSQAAIQQATRLMEEAITSLEQAASANDLQSLQPALAAEQAAYQALLKLRDREFNVSRSSSQQQGGSGGSAGSPSQRQLEQLELKNDENRYEQQRSAQSEGLAQQREMRQVLDRLRELAQRQNDLNERLKELQSALEAATEQEREELERQLKRLREQERQILRDTDELRERMEQENSRDQLADAREQVEQTRENVRRASDALEEGQLSQALTEGTRAGRQLEELRETVRKQAANQFEQEVTDLRDEARRLDEAQDELTKRLAEADEQAERSLRGGQDRERIQTDLNDQRRQLDALTERMRQVVQDAEETEPLLAEALFEAVKAAEEQSVVEALQAAERLTELGIPEEAAKASRHAGQGLDQLREDVERAAGSIIGDETAALQLAQAELDQLAEQLDREIRRSTDEQAEEEGTGSAPPGRNDDRRETNEARSGRSADENSRDERSGAAPTNRSREESQSSTGQEAQGQQSGSSPRGSNEQQRDPGDAGSRPSESDQPPNEAGTESGEEPGQQRGQGEGSRPANQSQPDSQGQSAGSNDQANPSESGNRRGRSTPGGTGREQQRGLRQGSPAGQPQSGPSDGSNLERLLDSLDAGGTAGPGGPVTGDGFRQWSDRMRDVEELLEDPELRAEAGRIRDRVRGAREKFKRHSKEPDWTQLQFLVAEPLRELRDRVAEEIRRRGSPDSLVPIDRDPVPPEFAEDVRRYYERLGSGR